MYRFYIIPSIHLARMMKDCWSSSQSMIDSKLRSTPCEHNRNLMRDRFYMLGYCSTIARQEVKRHLVVAIASQTWRLSIISAISMSASHPSFISHKTRAFSFLFFLRLFKTSWCLIFLRQNDMMRSTWWDRPGERYYILNADQMGRCQATMPLASANIISTTVYGGCWG